MAVPGRVIKNLSGDGRRCIVDENWLLMDILAIDQLRYDQSNDKRVKVVHGYIYEVLSEPWNREKGGTKGNSGWR